MTAFTGKSSERKARSERDQREEEDRRYEPREDRVRAVDEVDALRRRPPTRTRVSAGNGTAGTCSERRRRASSSDSGAPYSLRPATLR